MPKTYSQKRSFDKTPEPPSAVEGDVAPGTAPPGKTFVIHQHHATRLHYDLRLEMMNGSVPVLVSWAVPRNLPWTPGEVHLAVHVEDHPFEYGSFSGTIPKGEYGAGEVRIFDSGTYEVLEQEPGKLTFRLNGERRMRGVWHLFQTRKKSADTKDWLVRIREDERPEPESLPELTPMLATLAKEPFDDDDWIFEPKWDGVRALVTCGIEETMLVSRTGRDITATYPELAKLHDRVVAIDAILDGEIVAMEKGAPPKGALSNERRVPKGTGRVPGRPSFERLQSRINLQNPHDIARIQKQIPVSFVAYDILYIDGRSLLKAPLEERKEILADAVVVSDIVQVSPVIPGEGVTLFEAALVQRLEGIVAKKKGGTYRPGRRAKDWLKIKTVMDTDLVIGGWSPGEGNRSTTFGALIVGAYDADGLRFVGSVGTGFDQRALDDLLPRLKELETDEMPFVVDPRKAPGGSRFGKPIRDPHWIEPALVASVEFRELTSVGRLRAPSFKGLRPDKAPEDCSFADLARLAGLDA